MKLRLALAATVALALSVGVSSAGAVPFAALKPGENASYTEDVGVQFVFVGYTAGQVDTAEFLDELPESYQPVVRSRLFYDIDAPLGIDYRYGYGTLFTDDAWEDDFFGFLGSIAELQSDHDGLTRTLFQDQYNAQQNNLLDVDTNWFIDAPSVEEWLFDNAPDGVDPSRPTVFFVNWFGRDDFKFHTYVKFNEPDPDTGTDFGLVRQSRKIIAWGGTPASDEETGFGEQSRLWFYDLSAGPESWTDNWNVDTPDLDGNGVEDYRMPPIWEYADDGYRDPDALSGDLGLVARYVALNLLFTSSPLYPPDITPDRQPLSVNLDSNTYEGWKGTDASSEFQTPSLLLQEVAQLNNVAYNADFQDLAFTQQAKNCFTLWLKGNRCFPHLGYPGDANLFLYNAQTQNVWRGGLAADYEAGLFNYATLDNRDTGFLGFADDNYVDGTQSGVFSFVSPVIVSLGYGLTTTQIHEYGHHADMSHPHDGYDSETGVDYEPADEFYFAWSGDQSNSIMSYIDLNWDFSQFDLDNNNRFKASAFFRSANAIAEDVLADPEAALAAGDLATADGHLVASQAAFTNHDYVGAYNAARLAFIAVKAGADKAGVPIAASNAGWSVQAPIKGPGSKVRDYAAHDRYGPKTHRNRP